MQVHISTKHKMLAVPFAESVYTLFPKARQIQFAGAPHLLLPHQPTEAFMLRLIGYDVPAPILKHYDWCGGKPFESQKSTAALLTLEQRAYVLNGMGTGKTKSALWAFDYLRSNGLCGRMLISAPLSTLTFTWAREVFNTLPHRKCAALHGSKTQRLYRLADPTVEIFIINHDGHSIILDELLGRTDISVLCIDELAVFRHGSSKRSRRMSILATRMDRVWGMTGSPIPNAPTDAWAQARLVTPHRVPRYFGHYRDELMSKPRAFKWVPKPDAVQRAYDTLQPAVRFTLDDVTELPDAIERFVDVEMGAKQHRIYKALVDQCYAAVSSHEITAANAGAVMQKLLQVSTGWVYDRDRNVVALDNNKRIEALVDAINATDRKVLVFVPFKHALAGISEALKKEGIDHATVDGDTPAGERAQIFNIFQNTAKYRVLAAHPQCLAHGITLTAAATVIWFAPVTSLEIYDQANHRIRRVGQKFKQLFLHLQSTPVEKKIYRLLQGKQLVQNKLLRLFEEHTDITAEAA
jgi:SNF2 family DNA or RNA helicase